MRYAQIRSMDISNGEGIGMALFVQGCRLRCYNCFNKDTWDFNGGKEWTQEVEDKFIELASKPYIKRISLLGGECLAEENLDGILNLVNKIRLSLPEKTIWLYTGYQIKVNNEHLFEKQPFIFIPKSKLNDTQGLIYDYMRSEIIKNVDVLVDGRYIDSQRDITLKYRGSKNQRVIDVKQTLQKGEVALWTD